MSKNKHPQSRGERLLINVKKQKRKKSEDERAKASDPDSEGKL
jgi:hypothetical protein